jgi:hypothetical protein
VADERLLLPSAEIGGRDHHLGRRRGVRAGRRSADRGRNSKNRHKTCGFAEQVALLTELHGVS